MSPLTQWLPQSAQSSLQALFSYFGGKKGSNAPGVNISQTGIGNKNIALGTQGNDTITQSGQNAAMFALGLGGHDSFTVNGTNNTGVLIGSSGQDHFSINADGGFYKVHGGAGRDTLTLAGKSTDWKKLNGALVNSATHTRVYVDGVERILYALA